MSSRLGDERMVHKRSNASFFVPLEQRKIQHQKRTYFIRKASWAHQQAQFAQNFSGFPLISPE